MILKLLLLICIIAILWVFFTQFFWPAWNNRKLFPILRRDTWRINQDMVDANTRRHLAKKRVQAAINDADAVELEIEAGKVVDNLYDDLIDKVERNK
jgi:hypothetical protein